MVSQVKKEACPRISLPPRVTDTSRTAGDALTGHRKRNRSLICNRAVLSSGMAYAKAQRPDSKVFCDLILLTYYTGQGSCGHM